MSTWEDRYEKALDDIRDAQGDDWVAYNAADIEAAEEQATTGGSTGVGSDGICLSCGREYDDITDCPCPSDDCPSNEVA